MGSVVEDVGAVSGSRRRPLDLLRSVGLAPGCRLEERDDDDDELVEDEDPREDRCSEDLFDLFAIALK